MLADGLARPPLPPDPQVHLGAPEKGRLAQLPQLPPHPKPNHQPQKLRIQNPRNHLHHRRNSYTSQHKPNQQRHTQHHHANHHRPAPIMRRRQRNRLPLRQLPRNPRRKVRRNIHRRPSLQRARQALIHLSIRRVQLTSPIRRAYRSPLLRGLQSLSHLLPSAMQMRPHRSNRQAQRKRNLFIRPLLLMIKNDHSPLHMAQLLQLFFHALAETPVPESAPRHCGSDAPADLPIPKSHPKSIPSMSAPAVVASTHSAQRSPLSGTDTSTATPPHEN